MKQLSRYVARHVVAAILLVITALVGLFSVSQFAEELSNAPSHSSLVNVLVYVLFSVPGEVTKNASFALLIGSLLGLGVLASQSELTVMRASGVSVLHIVWMVIKPVLVIVVLIGLIREYIVPISDRYANYYQAVKIEADPSFNLIRSQHGLWMRKNNQFTHFNYINANGDIFGFARFAFNDKDELQFAQYAPHAVHIDNAAESGWKLDAPKTTVFEEDGMKAGAQEDYWQSELNPGLLAAVAIDPDEMSLGNLRYYMGYLAQQKQESKLFQLSFWKRALQPLAMIGLVLVAISFVFGSLRDTTMGYRLFFGVMVGMVFRFSQSILGPTSIVYGFSPWLGVAIPIGICWGLGFYLLSRVK